MAAPTASANRGVPVTVTASSEFHGYDFDGVAGDEEAPGAPAGAAEREDALRPPGEGHAGTTVGARESGKAPSTRKVAVGRHGVRPEAERGGVPGGVGDATIPSFSVSAEAATPIPSASLSGAVPP